MKRRHVFFPALVATLAAVAFGASSAFAENANLKFNPQTGELVYETFPVGATIDENKVLVTPALSKIAGYTVSLADESWAYPGFPQGVHVNLDDGAQQICFFDNNGRAVTCPAKKVTVKTGKADDEITVSEDLKIPTLLEGGPGIDWIQGGGGPDEIWGGCSSGDANCNGFKDTLHGGDGDDFLHGGTSFDYLAGDAGNDRLDGGLSGDNLNGGDGRDLADYSSRAVGVVVSLDGVVNDGAPGENDFIASDVEGVQGGSGKDTLSGNDFLNILKGGPADDYLTGYGGADLLMGEAGSDLLRPGFGLDNVYGGSEQDTVTFGERWNPVTVSLDGVGNDGEAGENDFVAGDVENVTGGGNNDTLIGDGHANRLVGGAGNDTLDGKGGQPDTLQGEAGNDKLDGGPAASYYDVLDGGADTDTVSYAYRTDGVEILLGVPSGAEDKVVDVENAMGGSGDDKMVGTDGPNAFFGNGGNDGLQGNGGDDHLYGGDDDDTLWGDAGNDTVAGGDGADSMVGGAGADWISGWAGVDTVSYDDHSAPVTVTLDGSANDGVAGEGDNINPGVENLVGGAGGDALSGDDGPNTITGGKGVDMLNGLGAADQLDGGAGKDVLNGGDGPDTITGGTEEDKLYGDAGYDDLRGGPGNDQLHGGADGDYADYSLSSSAVKVDLKAHSASGEGKDVFDSVENAYGSAYKDTLTGDDGPNIISGFGGNDSIVGAGGADHLSGADGDDSLRGDLGNDELNGGPGSDTVDYSKAGAAETVDLASFGGSATGGDDTDWLSLVENVIGSSHPDSVTGSADANVFMGGGGNDTLFGLGGDDSLDGQAGTDTLDGGLNTDKCLGEALSNCEK